MKIYCEQCGESYDIDFSNIPENKKFIKCKKCKNIINLSRYLDSKKNTSEKTFKEQNYKLNPIFSGIGVRLFFTFLILVLVMGVSLSLAYLNQVPKIIDSQIKLRAQVISKSLSAGISQPLLLKNYLAVSKIAAMHANFSDVSYAVVLNKNGIMITGLLSDEKKFSKNFNESLSVSGFPYELIIKNIPENKNNSVFAITLDGKKIYNSATEVGETGGTVHVGVFTDRAQQSIRETFFYLFLIFLAIVFLGSIAAFYIGRTISVPLSRLSIAAKKIAYGEIDTPIEIKGKGEIKILSQALEEMRGSVKSAIYRLRNK
jgi:predicted Zn finger-like uncharacterized protein